MYPHDDARCRQDSVDAECSREFARAIASIAKAAGLDDSLSASEVSEIVVRRLRKRTKRIREVLRQKNHHKARANAAESEVARLKSYIANGVGGAS